MWEHFLRSKLGTSGKCIVEIENGEPCNQIRSMGKNKSPSPLESHLLRVHKIMSKRGTEGDLPEPKRVKKEPLQSMVSHLATEGIPFSVIANSDTLRILFTAYGHHLPLSPNTIREMLLREVKAARERFISIFTGMKKRGVRFGLSNDEWTSTAGKRYANLCIHAEGKPYCLGLKRCLGSMPSEKCHTLITDELRVYDLEEKDIMGITTDGAKVMIKMGKESPFVHQQCIAHGLHLAVTDVLYKKRPVVLGESSYDEVSNLNGGEQDIQHIEDDIQEIEEDIPNGEGFVMGLMEGETEEEELITEEFNLKLLIDKVREVVYTFKGHPVRMVFLHKHGKEDRGVELGLLADCKTRWSSTHDMLERIMKIQGSVAKALIDVKLPSLTFTDVEIASLEVVSLELRVVRDTLKFLCSRDNNLLTMDSALTCMLNNMNVDTPFGRALVDATIKRINERRTIASSVMQYLDGGVNVLHPSFKGHSLYKMERFIFALWSRLHGVVNIDDAGDGDTNSNGNTSGIGPLNFMEMLRQTVRVECAERSQDVKGTGSADELKQELKNFKKTKVRGPKLDFIYNNMKNIQVSSVESERSFSVSGRFCNKLRSSVGDDALSALTMLFYYYKSNN